MRIGYLGKNPVTFSYQAALQIPGVDPGKMTGYATHRDVYDAVASGQVDLGVLAIENQLAGIVDECLHAIVQPIVAQGGDLSGSNPIVRITRELAVPVKLILMSRTGRKEDIKTVKTHAVPMRQARGYLDEWRKVLGFDAETCASTDAAAMSAKNDPSVAAIASEVALPYYSLTRIDRVDDPVPGKLYENVTRFWVIERQEGPTGLSFGTGQDSKVCLLFNLQRDQPGGLAKSLSVFAEENINLAHIYSLPRPDRPWEYTFVLEFEAEKEKEANVKKALNALKQCADYILLGMYPKYRLPE